MSVSSSGVTFLVVLVVLIVLATAFLAARLLVKGYKQLLGSDDVILGLGLILTYALMINGIVCRRNSPPRSPSHSKLILLGFTYGGIGEPIHALTPSQFDTFFKVIL